MYNSHPVSYTNKTNADYIASRNYMTRLEKRIILYGNVGQRKRTKKNLLPSYSENVHINSHNLMLEKVLLFDSAD